VSLLNNVFSRLLRNYWKGSRRLACNYAIHPVIITFSWRKIFARRSRKIQACDYCDIVPLIRRLNSFHKKWNSYTETSESQYNRCGGENEIWRISSTRNVHLIYLRCKKSRNILFIRILL